MRAALSIILLWAAAASAAPPALTIPAQTKGEPGAFVRVDAVTEGKSVRWFSLDKGLSVFPADLLRDQKTTVVVGLRPGSYRIACITCLADELSELAIGYVVIEGADPTPPPTPPTPPDPTPPADQLATDLGKAFAADADPRKVEYARLLASFYRQAAVAATSRDVTTSGQLYDLLKRTRAGLLPDSALLGIRQRAATELQSILPTRAGDPLTDKHRADAATLFAKLAAILGGVAK